MALQFHSGITRLRPLFQPLLRGDPSGLSWLPALLRLSWANPDLGRRLADECGPLLDWVSQRRPRPDRALRMHGIASVELEECFEYRLPPPAAFLRWLIEHPDRMVWPPEAQMSETARQRRREIFGLEGLPSQDKAKHDAISELNKSGAIGSNGKWWAFEGFTRVDCLLETEQFILLIEGKRAEPFSPSTAWYPRRNQVLRNLDVARQAALERNKDYAVLLMAEDHMDPITADGIELSLPHLSERQCHAALKHYLGCITWSQALARVSFPHTVEEAAQLIRAGQLKNF